VASLFWSFLLIASITLIVATGCVQQLTYRLMNSKGRSDRPQNISVESFTSVPEAFLTLISTISGGKDWSVIYGQLSDVGPFLGTTFLVYVMFVWLSVTNIITSIFVEKAMKLAKPDMATLMLEKVQEDLAFVSELEELFGVMKKEPTSTLSLEELKAALQEQHISAFLEIRGLTILDPANFFSFLCAMSENRELDVSAFVSGCMKMRGQAMQSELVILLFQTRTLGKVMSSNLTQCQRMVLELRKDLLSHMYDPPGDGHNVQVTTSRSRHDETSLV